MTERGNARKTNAPRLLKGCSCKKSQCIKNYCDCYQSMVVCTVYCKCLGCRNTEPRIVTTPIKNELKNVNSLREQQRKAQALQYNAVNSVISYELENAVLSQQVPLQQNLFQQTDSLIYQDQTPQTIVFQPQQTLETYVFQQQQQLKQKQQKQFQNTLYQDQIQLHQQRQQLAQQQKLQSLQVKQQKKEEQPTQSEAPKKKESTFINVLKPEVCDSALANLLTQEEESEKVGLDELHRRQILLNEMERCMSVIFLAQKRDSL